MNPDPTDDYCHGIVVGIEARSDREPALDFALEEALRRELPLLVVRTYETSIDAYRDDHPHQQRLAEAAVARSRARVNCSGAVRCRVTVLESDPTSALLRFAQKASLLVVGSRGHGVIERAALGSVSNACVRRSVAPVTLVPNQTWIQHDRWLTSRVLVALDGSPSSLSALVWAVGQAREWECSLSPVIVSSDAGELPASLDWHGRADDAVQRLIAAAGGDDLEVRPHFPSGNASDALLSLLDPADLLVMGSRGRPTLQSLLLGSTSVSVSERAPCPVTIVRVAEVRRTAAARQLDLLH